MMAERKKKVEKGSEPTEQSTSARETALQEWRLGGVFWGLLFVTIGVLALLNNFGYITLNVAGLFQLWPLLIIVWGVSLLRFKSAAWKVITILLMLVTLVFVSLVAVDASLFKNQRSVTPESITISQTSPEIKRISLAVDSGAGKVKINSRDMNDAVKADLYSNVAVLQQSSSREGSLQRVSIKSEGTGGWWIGGVRNDLDVFVSRELPVDLSITTGASELRADLSEVQLEKLDLDVGASNAIVRLGSSAKRLHVTIDAGASSLDLQIPAQSGVRVEIDEGLSSKGLRGFETKGEGIYETSNYTEATNRVVITGSIGATSFTIDRY